jgi:trans-2,3-dihydro-3-hydroxyanthranilate isomerase
VVHDADGVDDATMHAFARETRLSETTFVQTATEPGAAYRNRIWMPTGELPFAGHPSLGTAVAVARARGESQVTYVQQTGAGLQPVEVRIDGGRARASMLQELGVDGPEVPPEEALPPLGLTPNEVLTGTLPPQVVSTGLAQLIVPVQHAALHHIKPDPESLQALLEQAGATCAYVVAWESGSGQAWARSFFIDTHGVTEDPATGSAAGPLLHYLYTRVGLTSLEIHQGVEMGRTSLIHCRFDADEDRIRVTGDVVVVMEGSVLLDG